MNSNELLRQPTYHVCPECGQSVEEKIKSSLNECDHCLSKKAE